MRLADFRAPAPDQPRGARKSLERLALGRHAQCVAEDLDADRVVARCRIGGVSIGDLMRRAGVKER